GLVEEGRSVGPGFPGDGPRLRIVDQGRARHWVDQEAVPRLQRRLELAPELACRDGERGDVDHQRARVPPSAAEVLRIPREEAQILVCRDAAARAAKQVCAVVLRRLGIGTHAGDRARALAGLWLPAQTRAEDADVHVVENGG